MSNKKNSKHKIIWLSVLILFICVAVTTLAFGGIMDVFLPDDSGAISLIPDDTSGTESSSTEGTETQQPETDATTDSTGNQTDESTSATTEPTVPAETAPPKNPGFEASDDKTVWSTNTQVEIFKVSYENGEQIITVKSDNGDKVIAPGTQNSYTFKLKNTGNVALNYTVELEAYITPADITIPITGRLNRYDGKWVVGGQDEYVTVSVLDTAKDNSTLGAGKYTYYTLDWLWPFESGDDELDTLLGNLAAEQDLTFTIVIKTTATESSNPYDDSGITPPQTGDNSNITLWIVLAVSSFLMMLFLLFYQNKEKRRCDAEAD